MEVELTLKQKLLHEINTRSKFFVAELVRISGYSNLQNFKRCLTSDREFDKFQNIIDICEYIWGDKVVNLMSQYSTEIDPNKKTARYMLDWLSSSRSLDAFKSLLDRMENCSNKESREWSRVYAIQYKAQRNFPNVDIDEIIKQAKSYKTNIIELKIFLKLIQCNAYHQKSKYYMTKILAEEINLYISEIESDYISNRYSIKLSEIMSWIELRVFNKPEKCRMYADKIIQSQIGKPFKAFANFQKGYSYFFTSYEDSVKYFSESLKLYKEVDGREWVIKDIEEKIEFVNVYWNRLEKPECYDEKNYFLMNIKKGVNVGKLLDEYKGDKIDEPMMLFLKGYNNKDYTVLIESALAFVEKGDSFLANLPRNTLLEIGYGNIHLIDRLISIRVS